MVWGAQEDRRIRESDEAAHRANFTAQIEALTGKVKRTEEALRVTTTDYIVARRDKLAAEASLAEARATLEAERSASSTEVRAAPARLHACSLQATGRLALSVTHSKVA